MEKWKYSLAGNGKKLRELINNREETVENIIAVYKQMRRCLMEIKTILKKKDYDYFKDDINDLLDWCYIDTPEISDDFLEYEDAEICLNLRLEEFYDLCDAARVWLGV